MAQLASVLRLSIEVQVCLQEKDTKGAKEHLKDVQGIAEELGDPQGVVGCLIASGLLRVALKLSPFSH